MYLQQLSLGISLSHLHCDLIQLALLLLPLLCISLTCVHKDTVVYMHPNIHTFIHTYIMRIIYIYTCLYSWAISASCIYIHFERCTCRSSEIIVSANLHTGLLASNRLHSQTKLVFQARFASASPVHDPSITTGGS